MPTPKNQCEYQAVPLNRIFKTRYHLVPVEIPQNCENLKIMVVAIYPSRLVQGFVQNVCNMNAECERKYMGYDLFFYTLIRIKCIQNAVHMLAKCNFLCRFLFCVLKAFCMIYVPKPIYMIKFRIIIVYECKSLDMPTVD